MTMPGEVVGGFEFAAPRQILFGVGKARMTGPTASTLGRRPLLVTGRSADRAATVLASLKEAGLECTSVCVPGEPTTALVAAGVALVRQHRCDLVIAVGGGSVMDAGKAIAGMSAQDGEVMDYLEVIGRGRPLQGPVLPWLAIPTTAGTGAEVTKNAVLTEPSQMLKVSLRSPLLLAQAAIVDPELTVGLPPAVTAFSGLDALTQLMECYVSRRANALTDSLCREGIPRAARALGRAYHHGHDLAARSGMALASLFSGLALANAGLGAVHGFAGPIGSMFSAPHGAVCASLLRASFAANCRALEQRAGEVDVLPRFKEIAAWLTGRDGVDAEAALEWIAQTARELQVPRLRDFGIQPGHFPEIVQKAAQSSSMKGNPILLTDAELTEILARSW